MNIDRRRPWRCDRSQWTCIGRQYMAGLISNIGVFCLGASIGWVFFDDQISFISSMKLRQWTNAMMPLGAACFCMPMGMVMEKLGSKALMLFQVLPYTCGWLLLIFAKNIYMVFVGRYVWGICGAALCVAVPVYNVEISQLKVRGAMGSMFYGAIIYGIMFANVLESFLSTYLVNIILMLMAVLNCTLQFIPQSPTFYILHDKINQAEASIAWLHGDQDIDIYIEEIKEQVFLGEEGRHDQWCSHKYAWRSVPRSSIMLVLYQLSGGVVISGLLRDILIPMSETAYNTYEWVIWLAMIIGYLICFLLVDRVGRRLLLALSAIIMCLSALYICIWFKWLRHTKWNSQPLTALCIFIAAFSVGFGPLAWLLYVELIIEPLRPLGCAVGATVGWLTASTMTIIFAYHLDLYSVFYIMLIVCFVSLLFIVIFLPETKGLTSLEIQNKLGGKSNEMHSTDSSF